MSVTTPTQTDLTYVLLPGLNGTGHTFRRFLQHAPKGHDIRIVSYPADQVLSYDELLPLVVEQLPVDRPYVLLGESFSGPLSVRVAAQQPDSLVGLILCASFVRSPTPWYIRWWHSLFNAHVVRGLVMLESLAMRSLLGRREAAPECTAAEMSSWSGLEGIAVPVCPEVIAARVRSTLTVDVTTELQQVRVPMLYLAGRWDCVVPRRSRELIRRFRPDVEVRLIDGPHALLQARPGESWNAVGSWTQALFQPENAACLALSDAA